MQAPVGDLFANAIEHFAQEGVRKELGRSLKLECVAAVTSPVGEDAVRTAVEDDQLLGPAAHRFEDVEAVGYGGVKAGNSDYVLGGGDMKGGNLYRTEDSGEVSFTMERWSRHQYGRGEARITRHDELTATLDACADTKHRGVGAVGMSSYDDASAIHVASWCPILREQAVERESQVVDSVKCFIVMGGRPKSRHDAKRVAMPDGGVASNVLDMKACPTLSGQMLAQVGISSTRSSDSVGKDNQRYRRCGNVVYRPVQARGDAAFSSSVSPFDV